MADNLPLADPPYFALPDHAVAGLEGPDAIAFAQAQFGNDVSLLEDGSWQWNCWLTPKGRVIAVFALARISPEHLLAVLPDASAAAFAQALTRFVFRRKLRIGTRTDLTVAGAFAAPAQARGNRFADHAGELEFDLGSPASPRRWRLVPRADAAPNEDGAQVLRWQAADLHFGLPRLQEPQREQWTPQQLSLERLPAFSIKKGCYPGQEIVARTHFLGKAKRGLALFAADAAPQAGARVSLGGDPVGEVVSVAAGTPATVLAVMPLDAPLQIAHAGTTTLKPLALQDGLSR
ncbi:MAG: folate-binding protein [Pseudoxanthomonas sp.]